jgi:hypothetical protein
VTTIPPLLLSYCKKNTTTPPPPRHNHHHRHQQSPYLCVANHYQLFRTQLAPVNLFYILIFFILTYFFSCYFFSCFFFPTPFFLFLSLHHWGWKGLTMKWYFPMCGMYLPVYALGYSSMKTILFWGRENLNWFEIELYKLHYNHMFLNYTHLPLPQ